MNFKKFLRSRKKGQASIEYFILMVLIISLMALSVSNFLPNVKKSLDEKFFQKAVTRIISDSGGDGGDDGGGGCFLKGTKITLADGSTRAIDEIKVGEMVLGYNGKGVEPGKVIKTFYHPKLRGYLLVITEDNIKIKVTANHPVFTGKEFRPAGELKVGDGVFILDNKRLKPTVISSIIKKDEAVDLYNLKIAGLHNFFAEGLLCHNKPPTDDDVPMP